MISQDALNQLMSTTALPDAGPEPEPSPDAMDDGEFESVVRRLVRSARDIMDEEALAPLERAWRYFNGEVDQPPMGEIGDNRETGEKVYEGSSQVLTECWDQVQTLLPEVYRAIASSEEAVTFQPVGPEDTATAEQANDYCRHLFWDKNQGEQLLKDGLLEWMVKFCAFRVWREEGHKEHVHTFEDLDEAAVSVLQQTPNLEIEAVEPYQVPIQAPVAQPDGTMAVAVQPMTLYRVQCRYFEPDGKTKVALVPQDELLVDLEAQTLDDATVLGTDGERRVSDLVAMGLDYDKVKQNAGKGLRRGSRAPDIRRQRGNARTIERSSKEQPDDALWWVRTVDARVLVDRDGDGIAEPWRIIAVGEPLEIVSAVEDPGSDTIVVGSPFPRPHRVIGEGIVERTIDLQEIGTSLIRRSLDNYARAINPKPVVIGGGETSTDDLLSWFSEVVELPVNGRIDWLQVPFNAQHALPLLQFFGERRTLRTGISPASMGLDPNALKGQTVEGAGAIVAAPQSRAEGFAREFATRVLAPLYKALLRITVAYQDRPEVIRLRNEFVQLDPRSWNADMDVQVQIGTGTRQERIAALLAILSKQEQLYAAQSPLFDLKKYRQALADIAHEMGTKDDERYFPPVDDEMIQRASQQAEQQKQQAMQQALMIEQAQEQAKAQAQIAVEQAKAQAETAVEQVKAQLEMAARQRELAQEGAQERMRVQLEGMIKAGLLRIEGMIEERLMKQKNASAAAQGNIERRS